LLADQMVLRRLKFGPGAVPSRGAARGRMSDDEAGTTAARAAVPKRDPEAIDIVRRRSAMSAAFTRGGAVRCE
jgi:hypothetical protein